MNRNIYVTDISAQLVYLISPSGLVSPFAGSSFFFGRKDGLGSESKFAYPTGIAIDPSGLVYVADFLNKAIRKIIPSQFGISVCSPATSKLEWTAPLISIISTVGFQFRISTIVKVIDQNDMPVQSGLSVSLIMFPDSFCLSNPYIFARTTTNSTGYANFAVSTYLTISGKYWLQATVTASLNASYSSCSSEFITASPSTPSQIVFSVPPPGNSSLRNIIFPALIVNVGDVYGNGVALKQVTLEAYRYNACINLASSNLQGDIVVTTDASGYAKFDNVSYGHGGVSIYFRASVEGVSSGGLISIGSGGFGGSGGGGLSVQSGKENGNINIFANTAASNSWFHLQTLVSSPLHGLQVVEWVNEKSNSDSNSNNNSQENGMHSGRRLLSAGLSGQILEWNLESGKTVSTTSSFGGAIWCMKTCPSSPDILAIGCEDGAVRLFRILPRIGLEYLSALERQPCKVVSLDWHPTKPIILTGGTIGRARVLHLDTGRSIHHLTLDSAFLPKKKIQENGGVEDDDSTIVWQVLVLADGTLVTGDSLGHVCFWQGRSGTLLKKFPAAHLADVLALTASADGKTVYSSGVDRKICQFKLLQISKNKSTTNVRPTSSASSMEWMICGEKRYHTHDVNALCLLDDKTRADQFLVSGGVDTNLIFSGPLSHWTTMRQQRLEMTPQYTPVTLAKDKRLVMCMFDDMLKVWSLAPSLEMRRDGGLNARESGFYDGQRLSHAGLHKHVLTLNVPNGDSNLVSSAISECGTWIACSTMASVKLFHLSYGNSTDEKNGNEADQEAVIKVKQVKSQLLEQEEFAGASHVVFTQDATRLVLAGYDGKVHVLGLDEDEHEVEEFGSWEWGPSGRVSGLYLSLDSRFVVVATNNSHAANNSSTLTAYDMDTMRKWATLPSLSSHVVSACFSPTRGSVLAVATVDKQIVLVDVETCQMTEWSRRNMLRFPKSFTEGNLDTIRGVFFMESGNSRDSVQEKLVVWAAGYYMVIDLSRDIHLVPLTKSKTLHGEEEEKNHDNGSIGTSSAAVVAASPSTTAIAPVNSTRLTGPLIALPDTEQHLVLDHRFAGIMYFSPVKELEMVVVERPALQVLAELPAAFRKQKYGS